MSLNKGQKSALPSDQKFAKVLLKHFDTVKKHLLECPEISELFDEDDAEDEAEDMFDDEALEVLGGDSDDDEEEQVPSEDEDIEDDSDEELPVKSVKKIEQKQVANGKPATPKAALKAPVAESSDDDDAEDDEEDDDSEMEVDLSTPPSAKKPVAATKGQSTPAPGKKQQQKPSSEARVTPALT
uniref:Uncharacterized protein n=1 Tax=Panagrolaimus superbus TaxID=310955 RepID=A0A914Y4P2_9BILA